MLRKSALSAVVGASPIKPGKDRMSEALRATIAAQPEEGRDDECADSAFGRQMRSLRRERGLSLRDLAERSGVSVALISQVERGVNAPSMRSLRLLAQGLGVSVVSLFRGEDLAAAAPRDVVVRHDARRVLDLGVSGAFVELLTPPGFEGLQAFHTAIAPGGGSQEYDSHAGSEFGVVLCGRFDIWLDGARHPLGPGDSFSFQSETPHRYENPGNSMTVVVWSITPPIYR